MDHEHANSITVVRTARSTPERVWEAMTDPASVREWMMGATVHSDWAPGSPITWSGEHQGKPFEDRGEVVEIDRPRLLVHTHYSPSSGAANVPENHHQVTWRIADGDDGTTVITLTMPVESEEQGEEFARNWGAMLDTLTAVAER